MSSKPDLLTVARLAPFLMEPLQRAFTVHDRLHEQDPAAFARIAPRIRAICGSGESKVGVELMARLPALEIVSIMGVGYDGVDAAAAKARGVMVAHTPDVLNDDVADLALALMLNIARRIPQAERHVRDGKWPAGPMPLARKMSGARLGIVGMGRIGQAIAQRALAFGMPIAYTARSAKPGLPYAFHADPTGTGRGERFPRRHHPWRGRDAQADRRRRAARARPQRLPHQRGARFGGR